MTTIVAGRRIRTAWLVAGLAAVGVALRLAWQLRSGFYEAPPTFEEDEIAANILAGRGYVYHFLGTDWLSYGLPAFPSLLALLHFLDGGPDKFRLIGIVQASLSVVGVASAYRLGSALLSQKAGLLAAGVIALHPFLVILPARAVISAVYDQALTAVVLLALVALFRRQDMVRGLVAGLALALAVLLRTNVAASAELTLLARAFRGRRLPLVIATALFLVANLFNTARTQVFDPGGSNAYFCTVLWVGNNPDSTGGALTRDGGAMLDAMPAELQARIDGATEAEQGRAFCETTFAWWGEDPVRTVRWQLQKYVYFWWFAPLAGIFYPPGWLDAYRLAYGVELGLMFAGTVAVWRHGWREGLLFLTFFMAVVAASQTVLYVEGRHRLILEPAISALAACGAVTMGAWARAELSRRRALPVVVSS